MPTKLAADVGLRLEMRDEVGNPLATTCCLWADPAARHHTTFTARV
ncbi:MAG: hypothetical protein V8S13_06165 [Gemmiger formicilis]